VIHSNAWVVGYSAGLSARADRDPFTGEPTVGKLVNVMRSGLFLGLITTVAVGQTPTYSIEAVAVNGIPIPNGPTNHVSITHGDVVTAKIFIRNWSPNGEKLRAYQMQMNDASYASGEQGVVQPVDFQMNPDKDPNAFIDETDPQWVHYGLGTIPITDTVSLGYRWVSVLLESIDGPVSAQDGKKFSCATVKLTPSLNAKGTFTVALVEDPYITGLITSDNDQITPIEYERLTVDLGTTPRWRRVLSSDPPDGAVDARNASKKSANDVSWKTIRLTFNADPGMVSADDFTVNDGSSSSPRIQKISTDGPTLAVILDRPIRAGAWTTITHKHSSTSTRIGRFPGDVDGNGVTDTFDLLALLDAVNGVRKLPEYQFDIDGNGTPGPGDILQLLDMISEGRVGSKASGAGRNPHESSRP